MIVIQLDALRGNANDRAANPGAAKDAFYRYSGLPALRQISRQAVHACRCVCGLNRIVCLIGGEERKGWRRACQSERRVR